MVDRRQDMEGWGVYSIFKEAGRLLYQHIRILRPFILAFLLPLALVLFLQVIGIGWFLTWVADQVQPHHLEGISGHHHHHHHSGFHALHAAFSKGSNPSELISILVLAILISTISFLISAIRWLLASLAAAAIAKAIHHIYSSNNEDEISSETETQTQTQIHSIFASLPHSLYRIFIISLCFFVVYIFAYFLLALPFYFLTGPKFAPYHLITVHAWLWNLVFLILNFWFAVSVQVVVLESRYDGWAALQRSAKLVKAKAATALGLLVVYLVYFCVFQYVLQAAIVISAHSVVLYVVAGALAVGNLAFGAFWVVVVTVFYFVSKRKCGGEEGRQAEGDHRYQALDV